MDIHFTGYLTKKKRSYDEQFMRIALEAAELAKSRGDAAQGAVLAFPKTHIAEGSTVLSEHDPLGHAEINVLRKAGVKCLKDAVLYSSIEPCAMCIVAAYRYGIREVIFGAFDDMDGFVSSGRSIVTENFGLTYLGGVLSESCFTVASPSLRQHLRYIPKEINETSPVRNS